MCLDDTLSLGLAGLAATVALRGGEAWRPAWLTEILGVKGAAPDVQIPALSTYYRLTDDLCKAVGLEREGHEVARWDNTTTGPGRWRLSLTSGPFSRRSQCFDTGEPSDWLVALEAALAEVSP